MAIFGLMISDFRLLTVGNLPLFGRNLTSKGKTWRTKAPTVLVENASCSMQDRGSSGVLRLRSAGASLRSGWQTEWRTKRRQTEWRTRRRHTEWRT